MRTIFEQLKIILLESNQTTNLDLIDLFKKLDLLCKKHTVLVDKNSQSQLTALLIESLSAENDDICITLQKESQRILAQLRDRRGNFWVPKEATWRIFRNANVQYESDTIINLLYQLQISVDTVTIKNIQTILTTFTHTLPIELQGLLTHINTQQQALTLESIKTRLKKSIRLPTFFIIESNAYSTKLAQLYTQLFQSISLFEMSILFKQYYAYSTEQIAPIPTVEKLETKKTCSPQVHSSGCSML